MFNGKGRLLFVSHVTLSFLPVLFLTCYAGNSSVCATSCGSLRNISHPFRLGNDPENCGNHNYTLHCEQNAAVLYLYSGRYYVQAINYDNFTIRVVADGVQKSNCCSFPRSSLPYSTFTPGDPYAVHYYKFLFKNLFDPYTGLYFSGYPGTRPKMYSDLSQAMVSITCSNPVNSSLYVDIAPCNNGGCYSTNYSSASQLKTEYSYVYVGEMRASDLMESCRVGTMMLLPNKDYLNMSFQAIHDQLAYGFEVSWYNAYCVNCTMGCFQLDDKNSKQICGESLFGHDQGIWYDILWTIIETIYVYIYIYQSLLGHESSLSTPFYQTLVYLFLSLIVVLLVLKIFCGTPCVLAFLIYKWRRRNLSAFDTVEEFLQSQNHFMPIRYSHSQLRKITGGFKDKLGEGGFGCVYKGKLRSGHFAAVKVLDKSKAHGQDFISEVATIGRIHHANIVRLVGFCAEGSKRALVYDFMPNGSLNKHIFSREGTSVDSLSWEKLFEISLGVARGIEYLHRGCDIQILHFDIKPHNILLDENFNPKVSDFGLAKLYPTNGSIASLTAARGTIGYMAPELFYKNIGRVSYKADVYSFGMLLLEMAGKRKSLNPLAENSSQLYFPFWVHDQVSRGNDTEIVCDDATEEEHKMVVKMIIVGLWCIQMKPNDRPPMNRVVEMLEGDVESLQLPPKPTLYPEEERPIQPVEEDSSTTSDDSSATLIESATYVAEKYQ